MIEANMLEYIFSIIQIKGKYVGRPYKRSGPGGFGAKIYTNSMEYNSTSEGYVETIQ